LTDYISKTIEQNGIDVYRQDFNIDPLDYWRNNDVPDRQGITEIRYIEGFYEFWDELLRRHRNLLIDNCASGGRRIDLETISRSVPLWRADYSGVPAGEQALGVGLGLYVPLNSAGLIDPSHSDAQPDLYWSRSTMSAGLVLLWDLRRSDFDDALARRVVEEEKRIAKFYYGDLYPLTPVTSSEDHWLAYQCDRPDLGEGMVMAFRRQKNTEDSLSINLKGLKPDRVYELEDLDTGKKRAISGKNLTEGLRVHVSAAPGSSLLIYKELKRRESP